MRLSADQLHQLNVWLDVALDMDMAERLAHVAALRAEAGADQALIDRLARALSLTAGSSAGVLQGQDALEALNTRGSQAAQQPSGFGTGQTVGRYELLEHVASGGMGEVWLAERSHGAQRRKVALKLPHGLAANRSTAERFAREGQALARLNHPHVASLYDAGVADNGTPYLAMEWVEGTNLVKHCQQRASSVRERVQLLALVAQAVAHAHAQLVLHRDIKPANVVVRADGSPKLLDFGVAKLLQADDAGADATLTREAGVALTANYASPQQHAGLPPTVQCDVYALGVVMYELLAGQRPYDLGASRGLEALQAVQLKPPSAHNPALRGDLDAICLQAMALQPAKRYPTAQALEADLLRWLTGEPVQARSAGNFYVWRRFVGRHKLAVAAGAAAVASMVLGTGVALWQARSATLEAQRARTMEAFLLKVFDADVADGDDRLAGAGASARELLANANALVAQDSSLQGSARRDVLSAMAKLNADLGEHANALRMAEQALDAQVQLGGADTVPRQIGLWLLRANTSQLSHRPASRATAMAALQTLWERHPQSFGPNERALMMTLQALALRDADWPGALALAQQAHRLLPSQGFNRQGEVAVQRLAELYDQRHDGVAWRWQEAGLALANTRHPPSHPRVQEAMLRTAQFAARAGQLRRAAELLDQTKLVHTQGQRWPGPLQGGWWSAAGRGAMDSAALLAVAVAAADFGRDHGNTGGAMGEAALAANIAHRLRGGQDNQLLLAARSAYAQAALSADRMDLADVHTKAAARLAQQARPDGATEADAQALGLRVDYLTLAGEVLEAKQLLEQAQRIAQANGTALQPRMHTRYLLRQAALQIASNAPDAALQTLATAQAHLANASYFSAPLDVRRVALLRARALQRQSAADPALLGEVAAQLQAATGAVPDEAVANLPFNQSHLRLAGTARRLLHDQLWQQGEQAAACDQLLAIARGYNMLHAQTLSGGWLMVGAALRLDTTHLRRCPALAETEFVQGVRASIEHGLQEHANHMPALSPYRQGLLHHALM